MLHHRRGEKGSAQQAELIRYLHRQRDSLSQEVLRLQVLLERCGSAEQQCPVLRELQTSCHCLGSWLGSSSSVRLLDATIMLPAS